MLSSSIPCFDESDDASGSDQEAAMLSSKFVRKSDSADISVVLLTFLLAKVYDVLTLSGWGGVDP